VSVTASTPGLGARFLGLVFALLLGGALVVIAVPNASTSFARGFDLPWLAELTAELQTLTAKLPAFDLLVEWIALALAAYLGALLLISLRHWRPTLFLLGLATLVVATILLHLLAWTGFLAFHVARFAYVVFSAVSGFFAALLSPVTAFVGGIVRAVFGAMFGSWAWLAAIIAFAVVVWLAIRFGNDFFHFAGVVAGIVGVATGFVYLLSLVPESVWHNIVAVAVTVFLWLLWLFVVATVGQLFVDQLRGTVVAGSDARGVVMGAIAVGSALALLMLTGNAFDAYDFYPPAVATWAESAVRANTAPQFDAAVALVVIGLSALGVLSNLVHMRPSPEKRHLRQSLVYTIVGTVMGGFLAAVAKSTESR
jgi:hypothetical protein